MKHESSRRFRARRESGVQPTLPFQPTSRILAKDGKDVPESVRRYVTVLIRERMKILARLLNPELTLYEAAILLRVSRNTLRRLTNDGVLQCTRTVGKQRRFKLNDILVYLARNDPAMIQALQTLRDLSRIIAQSLDHLEEDIPPEP